MMDIRIVNGDRNDLGEGPLWDVDEQRLYWVNAIKGWVFRAAPDGSDLQKWQLPGQIGSMALRRKGGAVLALFDGLYFFDFVSGRAEPVLELERDIPTTRFNDGKVDRGGRFVFGSLDSAMFAPNPEGEVRVAKGGLYRLDTDLSVHKLEGEIGCSNGPCWSPDGRTFYFSDTVAGTLSAYDWDLATGVPSNKRRFASFARPAGMPDGCTVDAEGYVWSTGYDGGVIRRFRPDGVLDRQIEMPVRRVSSVMFGGPDLDILFVTSIGIDVPPPDNPGTGNLFAVHGLGVRGLPEPRFAG